MKAVSLRTYPLLTSRLQNVGNLLRRELLVLPLVLAVALIAVPHAPTMLALKLTLWISFGLCALSLDFIWGRGGIFSFGQTALFGLGAYAYAIIALNFYDTTGETISALIGAGAMGAVASAALGYFLFFSRLNDVYLSIVTLAVTLVIYTVLSSTAGPEYHIGEALLGGFNGIPGVPGISFPKWTGIGEGELSIRQLLAFSIVLAGVLYIGLRVAVSGRLGLKMDGLRSNELRMELLGYDIRRLKLMVFVIGGTIAGFGGGLFAAWGTFVNPSVFSLAQAATVVVWVMVGGRGSLIGAFLGVLIVQSVSDGADLFVQQQTPLIVGVILIVVVMLMPKGVAPSLERLLGIAMKTSSRAVGQRNVRHRAVGAVKRNGRGELNVEHIAKHFGGVHVLKGVTTAFGTHPVNAIIGPNGAGKSTFFNILTGRHRPDTGRVILNKRDVSRMPMNLRCQKGLGIKMQIPCIFTDLTVTDNLRLAAAGSKSPRSADDVLVEVGLEDHEDAFAKDLSHGQQQWLEIAMVLVQNPSVILLDEPGAGMGDADKRKTITLIHALAINHTIIVVEHDMAFIRALSAPVMMLHKGSIFRSGTFDELMSDDEVVNAYLGRRKHAA